MMQKSLSVLLLADDAMLSEAILAQFPVESGFVAHGVTISGLREVSPDIFSGLDLVLALNAANIAGQLTELLRRKSYFGPILHLTSKAADTSDLDVIRLPVRYPVLLQKMRSLAASYWFRDDLVIDLGGINLRPAFKELSRNGEPPVALTDKEVEILIYLYRAGGKIISRDVLLAEVWGYNADVSTHTLETHIYRLRQKIETEPETGGLLMTEAGGYRLNITAGE